METKLKGKTTIRCLYLALIELMLASSKVHQMMMQFRSTIGKIVVLNIIQRN